MKSRVIKLRTVFLFMCALIVAGCSVDGRFYPAEMHLVHQSQDGETIVLAVHQHVTREAQNRHVFDQIPRVGKSSIVELDLTTLLPKSRERFIYDGSLTTPPCTENVT